MNKHNRCRPNALFTIPNNSDLSFARRWLIIAISSLALAGLFAVFLVLARTPIIQAHLPWTHFFHNALIIHVNLSVLVWLLTFTALLWHFFLSAPHFLYRLTQWVSITLCIAGMLAMTLSPFIDDPTPLLNNYIPILLGPTFFLGLSLFATGIILTLGIAAIRPVLWKKTPDNPAAAYVLTSALISLIALISFAASNNALSAPGMFSLLGAEQFYELLFWGGGHILQFTYTQIMCIAWLWLANAAGLLTPKHSNRLLALFILPVILCLPIPLLQLQYDITSYHYQDLFTKHMRMLGGIFPLSIGLLLARTYIKKRSLGFNTIEGHALAASILLFAAGGFIGFLITNTNTTVPAHYHGSIVGVTLALMGLTYTLLPQLGFATPIKKYACIQPWLYGGGQLIHITGLAWSGGYGALRKTPGAMESIEGQTAMGLMGLGGLLSILGGLLFVIIVAKAIFSSRKSAPGA